MITDFEIPDTPMELPPLPAGWKYELLGDLVEERGICYGVVQPGREISDGIPIVRVNNLRDGRIVLTDVMRIDTSIESKYRRSRLAGDEVLLSLVGTLGQVAVVPESMKGWNVARAVGVIPTRKNPGSQWVALCLRSEFLQHCIRTWASTSVQATLNLREVSKLPIPIPPKETREAIARILGTLDDKIELNRRMNATLEAMARALFQSWFVDFDPVHAKAAGRQPSGMDAATAAIFPASFSSDDLPNGWRLGTINELCEINSWTLGKKDDLDELEYVEISEVNRGDIANISTYKRGEEPSRARRRLRHGDTAMSTVRPDRGSYFLALDPPEHRVVSTGFAVITPINAPWSFVHIGLTQPEIFERLGQLADGGAYPAVRPEVIGEFTLPIPDHPELFAAFHETCRPILEQTEANRIQSQILASLRDTLLPHLLRGK